MSPIACFQLDGEEVPSTDDDIIADDSTPAMSDEEEVEAQVGRIVFSGQHWLNGLSPGNELCLILARIKEVPSRNGLTSMTCRSPSLYMFALLLLQASNSTATTSALPHGSDRSADLPSLSFPGGQADMLAALPSHPLPAPRPLLSDSPPQSIPRGCANAALQRTQMELFVHCQPLEPA